MNHPSTRAERRNAVGRAKSRAIRRFKQSNIPLNPRLVGRDAAMHGTCPCWMCTMKENPFDLRQYLREHTITTFERSLVCL